MSDATTAPHPDSDQTPLPLWWLDRAKDAAAGLRLCIATNRIEPSHSNLADRLDALAAWPVGYWPSNLRTAVEEAERQIKEAS